MKLGSVAKLAAGVSAVVFGGAGYAIADGSGSHAAGKPSHRKYTPLSQPYPMKYWSYTAIEEDAGMGYSGFAGIGHSHIYAYASDLLRADHTNPEIFTRAGEWKGTYAGADAWKMRFTRPYRPGWDVTTCVYVWWDPPRDQIATKEDTCNGTLPAKILGP